MERSLVYGALLGGVVACLVPTVVVADSLACDGGIVTVGDSRLDLLGKCGRPTLQELEAVALRPYGNVVLPRERWTYDFGPQRFMQVVTLESGKVLSVERGNYGYVARAARDMEPPPPRATCGHDAFQVGDRALDVLTKCGEPVSRESGDEIWVYNFGPQELVRFLEFTEGRLTSIRTGEYGY